MTDLFRDIDAGPNPPETINVVVECLKGERNKYEYDKDKATIILDRVLHSNVHYPADYGFIPQTHYDDGDPLDVLLLVQHSTFPGCVVTARPIGMLLLYDSGEQDDKILAVPTDDPNYDHIHTLDDLQQHTLDEITEFFATYKNLEPDKTVEVIGWDSRNAAEYAIEHAQDLHTQRTT